MSVIKMYGSSGSASSTTDRPGIASYPSMCRRNHCRLDRHAGISILSATSSILAGKTPTIWGNYRMFFLSSTTTAITVT